MGILKDMNEALYVDKRIESFFEFLTNGNFKNIKDNFYFYKIRGSIEKGTLKVEMFFQHKDKWYFLGEIDLENNKVIKHIDKKLFKVLLESEDRYLIENSHKEIQRSLNIIISLFALILGFITAFIVLNLIK